MPASALLGRDREIEELTALVREHRLITVTGTGGIGKTSLAARVAATAATSFRDGLRRLELARIEADGASTNALAGLVDQASFDSLRMSLADKELLVLLDNCEHVRDAAAAFASGILDACPAVTILATSREPLALRDERVLALEPLALPTSAAPADAPSVQLFLERARAAGATVREPDELGSGVPLLCRRLDGIPLAIELAAARSRTLTPDEMLRHLDRRLDLLERRRGGGDRHRSLRATLDWSYALLDESTRDLFACVGVFAGPFTASMAHAVWDREGSDELDTLAHLQDLVDGSLVLSTPRDGTTWYAMFETLRAYALERLADTARHDAAHDRYADCLLAGATALLEESTRRWSARVLRDLLDAYPHLRAALLWSLSHDAEPTRTFTLMMLLWGVMHQAHAADVAELGERVLARFPARDDPLWCNVASTTAGARLLLSRNEGAEALARESLDHAPADALAQVTSRRTLAFLARSAGDLERAEALFAEGARFARDLGVRPFALELEVCAAQMKGARGEVGAGVSECRRVCDESGACDSPVTEVWARTAEASLLLSVDPEAARDAAEGALASARRIGYPWAIGANLRTLGVSAYLDGDPVAAASRLEPALRHFLDHGDRGELANVLRWAAVTIASAGECEAGAAVRAGARALAGISVIEGPESRSLATHEARLLGGAAPASGPREAVAIARRELRELAHGERSPQADGGVARLAMTGASSVGGPPVRACFRREPAGWLVGFAGRTTRAPDAKGMHDLARLLAEPGREWHCLDLAGSAGSSEGHAGEVLDAEARRQYERRARELQEELALAEEHDDLGRSEVLRAELEAIAGELAAAFGLGGRARKAGDPVERARSTVTRRIRAAIERLADLHPELGRHLRNSTRTGTFCVYEPERSIDWDV